MWAFRKQSVVPVVKIVFILPFSHDLFASRVGEWATHSSSMVPQCFPKGFVRLWWVDLWQKDFAYFWVKCISPVNLESKIKRLIAINNIWRKMIVECHSEDVLSRCFWLAACEKASLFDDQCPESWKLANIVLTSEGQGKRDCLVNLSRIMSFLRWIQLFWINRDG